jgi:hypothetical protein
MAIDVASLIPFAVSQISDHIEIKIEFIKGLTLYLIRHRSLTKLFETDHNTKHDFLPL